MYVQEHVNIVCQKMDLSGIMCGREFAVYVVIAILIFFSTGMFCSIYVYKDLA